MAPRALLGKADLTGLIADAQGVYHDLSKGSFDAFSIKHPGASEHLSTALFNQPLVQGIHELATEAGIDLSAYDSLDMKGAAVSMAQHLAIQRGQHIDDHYIAVVDLASSSWDWSQGEPPEEDPA